MYTYTYASNLPNLIKKLYIEYPRLPVYPFWEEDKYDRRKHMVYIKKNYAICNMQLQTSFEKQQCFLNINWSHYSAHKNYQLPKIK